MATLRRFVVLIVIALFLATFGLLISCGGGGGGSASVGSGSGTLSLSLTDASTDRYQAIYITIDEIQVHMGGNDNAPNNWTSVDMPVSPITLNLLELINGVRENLGLASLSAGRYTQMRLIIGKTPDGSINLFSIKIVKGFDIHESQTTELVLDFDACRSVVEAGNSGNWLLKPTIKVAELNDFAIIQGIVTANGSGVEGAMVSAQIFNGATTDPKDQVIVKAATITDESGEYRLFVEPGIYNLVAYADRAEAAFTTIITNTGQTYDKDVALLVVENMGRVSGKVTISGADDEQNATLSFLQDASGDQVIEIKAINILNEVEYTVALPEGDFKIVGSSYGNTTTVYDITVDITGPTIQNIVLP
ncbi:MAG: DUF4382 domain-containing protein [Desulfosarcina sp.]|nr:DUF4382 domain-containing protein [Desulfosarcina sp.]